MRTHRITQVAMTLATIFPLWFSGCSSGDGGADSNESGSSSAKDEFARAYCEIIQPCCGKIGQGYGSDTCTEAVKLYMSGHDYDQSSADQCIAAMRSASSDPRFCYDFEQLAQDNGACQRLFNGTTPKKTGHAKPGESCYTHLDCEDTAQGRGLCIPYGHSGSNQLACVAVSTGKSGDSPCLGTKHGDTLSFVLKSQLPTTAYICNFEDGLYCNHSSNSCQPLGKKGDTCSNVEMCTPQNYCDFDSHLCKTRAAVGAKCEKIPDSCVQGAYCGSDNTCHTTKKPGEECNDSKECGGASCDNGKCWNINRSWLSAICTE